MRIWILISFFAFVGQLPSTARTCVDSIKQYNGYRLMLTSINLEENQSDHLLIKLNLINTGRMAVQLGEGETLRSSIQLKFEESFFRSTISPYHRDIEKALLEKDLNVPAGKILKAIQLQVNKNKALAESYQGQSYESKVFNKKSKKNKSNSKSKETSSLAKTDSNKKKPAYPKFKKQEKKKEEITSAPRTNSPPSSTKEKRKLSLPNFKKDAKNNTSDTAEKTKEKKKFPSINLPQKRKVTQEEREGVSFTTSAGVEASKNSYEEKSLCIDLTVDTVIVIKEVAKKWLTIEYTITNRGKSPADLYGKAGDDNDNLALRAFLATSPKLSRGSIPIGGTFINSGLEGGLLYPNQSYTNKIKLDIRKITRFTPYVILHADPFNTLNECDKTNNKKHLFVD